MYTLFDASEAENIDNIVSKEGIDHDEQFLLLLPKWFQLLHLHVKIFHIFAMILFFNGVCDRFVVC